MMKRHGCSWSRCRSTRTNADCLSGFFYAHSNFSARGARFFSKWIASSTTPCSDDCQSACKTSFSRAYCVPGLSHRIWLGSLAMALWLEALALGLQALLTTLSDRLERKPTCSASAISCASDALHATLRPTQRIGDSLAYLLLIRNA